MASVKRAKDGGLECVKPHMIGGFNVDVDTLLEAIEEWKAEQRDAHKDREMGL